MSQENSSRVSLLPKQGAGAAPFEKQGEGPSVTKCTGRKEKVYCGKRRIYILLDKLAFAVTSLFATWVEGREQDVIFLSRDTLTLLMSFLGNADTKEEHVLSVPTYPT